MCYNTNEVICMNINPSEIGERIKTARKAAKLSQTDLANALGKTLRTVQKYESGEIEPSITTINETARILKVSPAYLAGYNKPEMRIDSVSDVLSFFVELRKKAEISYEIDVRRPPHYDGWNCAIRFEGKGTGAKHNDSLCLILEQLRDMLNGLENYYTSQEHFDRWLESELAYYMSAALTDKEVEELSEMERLERRIEADRKYMEKIKAAEENGSQDE